MHDFNSAALERNSTLLEAANPDLQVRAVRRVFDGLRPREVRFLWASPADLGFRAEAVLAGATLDDDDGACAVQDSATFERLVPEILSRLERPKLVAI